MVRPGASKNVLSQYREPLTGESKRLLLASLVRSQRVFDRASGLLRPEHFGPDDWQWRFIWQTLLSLAETVPNARPTRPVFTAAFWQTVGGDVEARENLRDFFKSFTKFAFGLDDSDIQIAHSVELIKQFMEEATSRQVQAVFNEDAGSVSNLPDLVREFSNKLGQIATVAKTTIELPFAGDWKPEPVRTKPTNIGIIDYFIGGHAGGEVYGLMGPYGSCKTTFGIAMAVEGGFYEYRAWQRLMIEEKKKPKAERTKPPLGLWLHFSYEGQRSEIKMRSIVYAARIRRSQLSDPQWQAENLSNEVEDSREFRNLFESGDTAGLRLGAKARFDRAIRQLNNTYRIFDMSGNDPNDSHQGSGYVEEIRTLCQAALDSNSYQPCFLAGIVVDYAGIAVKRYCTAHNLDPDRQLRHLIGDMPLLLANRVATPFNCPVWLLHQLSAASNAKSVGAKHDHTDAAEARNFAENLHFCYTVGRLPDVEPRLAVCSQVKQRRTAPKEPQVIQLIGDYGVIRHATQMRYNPSTRKFEDGTESRTSAAAVGDLSHRNNLRGAPDNGDAVV